MNKKKIVIVLTLLLLQVGVLVFGVVLVGIQSTLIVIGVEIALIVFLFIIGGIFRL